MLTPVNHAPTPVMEGVSPSVPGPMSCEQLKVDFNIETGCHKENREGSTKKNSSTYQSHHILQDAATNGIVSRDAALAVMLADSCRDTEHQRITARQNERRDNKKFGRGGSMPGSTFGEVKKQSKEDISAALAGKRKNKEGREMTKEEADFVADCLVVEAEKEAKRQAKKDGKKLDDNTPVERPGGCFTAGTLVWLDDQRRTPVEALPRGARLETSAGSFAVVRVDQCHHDVVTIVLGGGELSLASFHRVVGERGALVRAGSLRVGDVVQTHEGPRMIEAVRRSAALVPVHSFGLGPAARCRIGEVGVWVEVPASGPPVVRSERIEPWVPGEFPCP